MPSRPKVVVLPEYGTPLLILEEVVCHADPRNVHKEEGCLARKPALVLGVVSCTPKNTPEPPDVEHEAFMIGPECDPPVYTYDPVPPEVPD